MGKIAIGLFVLCLMLMMNSVTATPWDSSWNCYKPITINHTYVSGEQTDFTMLIDITDSDLAAKAQADGNDIVFVTSDNTVQLDHQIEGTFDSTTGYLKAWIRIPTLSNTADTVINMYYNNSGAINTENPGGVWGVNASGIWLMDEGTGNDVNDSSGNGNDGVNNGADWVADGLDFNGASDYIEVNAFSDMVTTKAYTVAYRLNTTQSTLTYNARHVWIRDGTDGFGVAPNETGKIFIYTSDRNTLAALGEATSINDGEPHEIVAVFDQVNDVVNIYIDGILDYQVTSYDDNLLTTNAKVYIGCNGTYEGNYNGTFEYIHIYDRALSAEEVGTRYSNTNSPSTFSTVGTEQTEAASNAPNITSWFNSKTNDLSLDITVNISEDVNFNATANQSNITWIWYKDEVAQSCNHDNISLYWTTTGNRDVIVNATNANGTSNNVTWIITVLPSDDYMPKLVVSSNGHYLEDTDGEPFIWIGEVLWKMVQEINRTDVEFTLDELDAPDHEYSVVYSVIIMRLSGWPENPTNVYGHQPFNGGSVPDFNSPKVVAGGDPDNPNDYWDHLDFMVRETKERGMYFVLLPQWGNAYMNGAYSTTTINASTARAYGEWLGNRYKDENHIIWMLGGDGGDPDAKGTKEIYQAQAEGILKGVTGCTICPAYNESDPLWDDVLMLYHATSGTRSSQFFDAEDVWMDIDGTYNAYKDHFYLLTDAYNQANPRPAIEIEGGGFWAMHDKNLRQIRMLPYMHYLSGGVGPLYIDGTVWDFSSGWEDKLEVSERDWVGNMKWVMSSIDWYKLVPDSEIILSDNGTGWGEIMAACSSDGDLIMVSFSKVSNGSAQINLSNITSHTSVRGVWICPSNRDMQNAGVYSVSDDPWFTTPTCWEDAILKLEGVVSSYNDSINITSWQNNKTNDDSLDITVTNSGLVNFNATFNQSITTWIWRKDGVDQSHNYDNITVSWGKLGDHNIALNAENANGTSNTTTWNITIENPAWYDTNYTKLKNITIVHDYVNGTQCNHPVYINITDSDLIGKVQDDGDDIIFVDYDTFTQIPHMHEREYNSTTGHIEAWFNVPCICGDSNTIIQMYYNNSGATDSEDSGGTWQPTFEAVYLMNEGTGQYLNDSSGNNNNGTGTNLAWGRLGLELYGSNEHVSIPNFIGQDDDWTIITRFIQDTRNPFGQSSTSKIVSMQNGTGIGRNILYIRDKTTYKPTSFIDGSANSADTTIETGTTYGLAFLQSGRDFNYYLNGTTDGSFSGTANAANGNIILFDNDPAVGDGCFDGTFDYLFWYIGSMAQGTIETIHNNTNSPATFSVLGSEELMGTVPSITSWQNNKTSNNILDITINVSESVKFNATADQSITTWSWYYDGANQSHNYDNISLNWSSGGLKTVIVNATNSNGTSDPVQWNVTVSPVAGKEEDKETKAGGGGRGGTSREPYANNEFKDDALVYISKDAQISFTFDKPENDIQYVRYRALTNAGYISTVVEMLKDTSTFAKEAAPEIIYKNINIWVGRSGYATDKNIENPVVGFKVEKKWVEDNNIEESSIKLNRYHEDTWNALSTAKTDEDASYVYFESQTPGFSPFSITGQKKTLIAPTLTMLPEESTEVETPPEPMLWWKYLLTGTIILLIITGAYLYLRKQQS